MYKKILILILMTAALCSFFGCKKTPDNPIVINKNDGALEEKISKKNTNTILFPENWEDHFQSTNGFLTVKINADIITPEVTTYPVTLIEPMELTQETADRILGCLIGDAELYQINDILTKEKIQKQIEFSQYFLEYVLPDYRESDPVYYEWKFKDTTEFLNHLYQQWENAPENLPRLKSTGLFESSQDDVNTIEKMLKDSEFPPEEIDKFLEALKKESNQKEEIRGEADLGKMSTAVINIFKKSTKNQGVDFHSTDFGSSVEELYNALDKENEEKIKISINDALEEAYSAIDEIGIKDMYLYKTGYTTTYQGEGKEPGYAFRFIFTKSVNEIPITYVKGFEIYTAPNVGGLREPWLDEKLEICIDETGIIDFKWKYPAEIKEVINDSVELLSFDDVRQRFKGHILHVMASENDESVISKTLIIDRCSLGLAKVAQKNSDKYMLIPVWDFFGYITYEYVAGIAETDENNEITYRQAEYSFLTINAIDGSVIDRNLGY